MTRHRIAVLAVAVVVIAAGCSGGTEAEPPATEPAAASASAPTESATPASTDPLEAVPAEKMLGQIDLGGVVQAKDGTHLVVSSTYQYAGRSVYRLYDRRWAPLTPMLEVRGLLSIDRGLRHSFLGSLFAYREKGLPRVNERVLISGDGTLRTIDGQVGRRRQAVDPRPGDWRLASVQSGRMVYRPADRTVYRATAPEWDTPGRSWYVTAAGDICALEGDSPASGTVHTSVDEGRTFTDLSAAVLPANSGPRLQSCQIAGDRVVVMTGGEYPQWLHVLDRVSGALVVSHDVGDQNGPYNPYDWRLLPDGKLVINTNRPGLYVATDTSNGTLEYRPRPRAQFPIVVGDDLALVSGGGLVHVSTDEGRTWETVDLQASN